MEEYTQKQDSRWRTNRTIKKKRENQTRRREGKAKWLGRVQGHTRNGRYLPSSESTGKGPVQGKGWR